jgi:hypothetical protein
MVVGGTMLIFLSMAMLVSGEVQAEDSIQCETQILAYIEGKGCKPGLTETNLSGLRAATCNEVPVFALIDQSKFDLWAADKAPEEIELEMRRAWDVPASTLISDVFENTICVQKDGNVWSQIRKKVVTR